VWGQRDCPWGGQAGQAHLGQRAAAQRLAVRRVLLPQLALALQLGELGLLCEDLVAALLHCRLHGGVDWVWRRGDVEGVFWNVKSRVVSLVRN
jgi:hypothetical protein